MNRNQRNPAPGTHRVEGGLRVSGRFEGADRDDCPMVSVVTVVLNRAHCVEKAIASVLEQTYPNVEYIIIDGGSTDGTLDIIRKHDDRIAYWISEPDAGVFDALNKGQALCTGRFWGICLSDDWLAPDAVASAVAAFRDADVVCGAVCKVRGDYRRVVLPNAGRLRLRMSCPHPALFLRRGIEGTGVFDLRYCYAADYDFVLRLYLGGRHRFREVQEVLAYMSTGGQSSRHKCRVYWDLVRINFDQRNLPGMLSVACRFPLVLASLVTRKTLGGRIHDSLYRRFGRFIRL